MSRCSGTIAGADAAAVVMVAAMVWHVCQSGLGRILRAGPTVRPHGARMCARTPLHQDSVSERLRRWTRNPLGSARRGSNPLAVDLWHGRVAPHMNGTPDPGARASRSCHARHRRGAGFERVGACRARTWKSGGEIRRRGGGGRERREILSRSAARVIQHQMSRDM